MSEKKKIPNANKKLRNNEAVRKMLDGTHHTQTRQTSGWTGATDVKREVGERWTDANGVLWEQREGYRVKGVDRADRLDEINKYLKSAKTCPNCNEKMSKRLDKKYYGIHKMCMECSIKLETEMRANGTWEQYERERILSNVKSWLKDAEIEKNILLDQVGKDSYVTGDGNIEKWELPYDVEEQKQRIEKGFINFKRNLLNKYGATEQDLEEFGVVETGEEDVKKD